MSHHLGLKKHLTTQLELLDESSFHLQSSISAFVQQIKKSAMECVENISGTNTTIKEAVAMVTTAQNTLIEHADLLTESTMLYYATLVKGEKTKSETDQCISETIRRLKEIETALSSIQDTKQNTEDDISEIKQWSENFVTEQSDLGIKVENLSKKQKQNFKNLRKQLKEQNSKIEVLTQQIESFKTKESDTDKTLEKLSLDMKEYENNLHTLNKDMKVYTYKADHVTQEIKRHSDLISAIQEDTTKTFDKLMSKHVVMCKLLQQRLVPIDKMIETYNQNSKTKEEKMKKIETLEKEVLKLSQDLQSIANQHVKHYTLGFIASRGRSNGEWYKKLSGKRHQVITFSSVERNIGDHFDANTGVFTAPVAGLYKASLTIKQTGGGAVAAGVGHISSGVSSWLGEVWTKDKVETSETFEILMKNGDILFSFTGYADCYCTHFSCSLLSG